MRAGEPPQIGRFRIAAAIGSGSTCTVYLAMDTRGGAWRALKVLSFEKMGDERARKRFRAEAEAARSVHYPSLLAVIDADPDDPYTPWIAFEVCEGGSLQDWLEQHGPMPAFLAIDVMVQVCGALAAAHKVGIAQRRLEPQDVLLDRTGKARIKDFRVVPSTTTAGFTPDSIDLRDDLSNAAMLLHHLLTGEPYVEGGRPVGVPDPLRVVIARAMQRGRGQGYPDAAAMSRDLEAATLEVSLPTGQVAPLVEGEVALPPSVVDVFDPDTEFADLARAARWAEDPEAGPPKVERNTDDLLKMLQGPGAASRSAPRSASGRAGGPVKESAPSARSAALPGGARPALPGRSPALPATPTSQPAAGPAAPSPRTAPPSGAARPSPRTAPDTEPAPLPLPAGLAKAAPSLAEMAAARSLGQGAPGKGVTPAPAPPKGSAPAASALGSLKTVTPAPVPRNGTADPAPDRPYDPREAARPSYLADEPVKPKEEKWRHVTLPPEKKVEEVAPPPPVDVRLVAVAGLALVVLVLGTFGYSMSVVGTAEHVAEEAAESLTAVVDAEGTVVNALIDKGADKDKLEAAFFTYRDTRGDERYRQALVFATLVSEEAARVGVDPKAAIPDDASRRVGVISDARARYLRDREAWAAAAGSFPGVLTSVIGLSSSPPEE